MDWCLLSAVYVLDAAGGGMMGSIAVETPGWGGVVRMAKVVNTRPGRPAGREGSRGAANGPRSRGPLFAGVGALVVLLVAGGVVAWRLTHAVPDPRPPVVKFLSAVRSMDIDQLQHMGQNGPNEEKVRTIED